MTGPAAAVRRTRSRLPLLAVAGALLLAGCGTGLHAQTYEEKASLDSSNEAIGELAVRNLAVSAPRTGTMIPQGTDAPMTITVVNEGGQSDTLVSARAPDVASGVDVLGGGSLEVPALGTTGTRYSLVLRDLVRPLDTGTYVSITLSFQRNGEKTMLVPVQVTNNDTTLPKNEDYKVPEADSQGNPLAE